jgi:hypothetical protein
MKNEYTHTEIIPSQAREQCKLLSKPGRAMFILHFGKMDALVPKLRMLEYSRNIIVPIVDNTINMHQLICWQR